GATSAPGGSCPSSSAEVPGPISNTTQYTYGVIGASASSKTSAIDLVPAGAPAQVIGGVASRFPAQVNRTGMTSCGNSLSATVITLGAVTVTPDEKSPQPASGTASATAATAVAARLAGPRRRRALISAAHFTRQSLGAGAGWGSRYGADSSRRADLANHPGIVVRAIAQCRNLKV